MHVCSMDAVTASCGAGKIGNVHPDLPDSMFLPNSKERWPRGNEPLRAETWSLGIFGVERRGDQVLGGGAGLVLRGRTNTSFFLDLKRQPGLGRKQLKKKED